MCRCTFKGKERGREDGLGGEENAGAGLSSPWDVAPPSHTDGSLGSPDYENVKARGEGVI